MKKYGWKVLAGLATLAMASTSPAQTTNTLRITGSSAYRAATHNAILAMLDPAERVYGFTGSSLSSASRAQFTGRLAADTNVICNIQTVFSGSVDGVIRLVYRGSNTFDRTDWPVGTNLTAGGTASISFLSETAPSDVAMSDAYQNSTKYTSPTLVDNIVGVIPFIWVRNSDATNAIANMTPLLAQQVLAAGSVPLSFFTGNAADTTKVRSVGRNADSGTRVTTFAETGFGIFTPPSQWQVLLNGSSVTNVVPYPAETVLGESFATGQSGYGSGGTIVTAFNATGSNAAPVPSTRRGWLISALGVSDANNVNSGNNKLTWNGVAYSQDAVRNGQYTFWSYEHLFYGSYVSGNATLKTIADQLVSTLLSTDPGTAAVQLSTMKVTRGQEGAPVSP